jgi:hypothetical protein
VAAVVLAAGAAVYFCATRRREESDESYSFVIPPPFIEASVTMDEGHEANIEIMYELSRDNDMIVECCNPSSTSDSISGFEDVVLDPDEIIELGWA